MTLCLEAKIEPHDNLKFLSERQQRAARRPVAWLAGLHCCADSANVCGPARLLIPPSFFDDVGRLAYASADNDHVGVLRADHVVRRVVLLAQIVTALRQLDARCHVDQRRQRLPKSGQWR